MIDGLFSFISLQKLINPCLFKNSAKTNVNHLPYSLYEVRTIVGSV